MSLAVLGEALIDMIATPDGKYKPVLGGSPYNLALGLARQEQDIHFLAPFSTDQFGRQLQAGLLDAGVKLPDHGNSPLPTSLALVTLDAKGQPSYSLYREGIADRDIDFDTLVNRLPEDLTLFQTGSLVLMPDTVPMLTRLFDILRERDILISIDINMRPNVVKDCKAYAAGIRSLLSRCDLIKGSDEDFGHLGLADDPLRSAQLALETMGGGLVALTLGGKGGILLNRRHMVDRKGYDQIEVKDTIGAGDCFQAGLLSYLTNAGVTSRSALEAADQELLAAALEHASASAALNIMQSGCQPPTAAEVNRFKASRRD